MNNDSDTESVSFCDKLTINDIADVFELVKRHSGKHASSCYDAFPELELLAKFIDDQFYLLTNTENDSNDSFVRSVASCHLNFRRCGARYESNSQRSYFEGHERQDVVQHREKFVQHYIELKDLYYSITERENPRWQMPTTKTPIIYPVGYDMPNVV
ncbi:unnamed protein product [Rotaria sp. Silwood2]|nr:unnamed protein product [Rotaria sp. Silwood2]CAF2843090.1 unnamed protein product [Rotaria sp. Silwood2]CAF3407878.1 unnamed protein product [Rotaria sp. Silwood2]CAF4425048.1 unnamed protein product [Rotaria sp. Silwood2]CAF4603605.1 unnamed protein product [Rotaria sp. Silwood2]